MFVKRHGACPLKIAIVGGGPAGTITASTLLRTCGKKIESLTIFEREKYGARSYCAGGLGYLALKEIRKVNESIMWFIDNTVVSVIDRAVLFIDNRDIEIRAKDFGLDKLGYVIDRRVFDYLLQENAVKHGASIIRRHVDPEGLKDDYDFVVDARGSLAWRPQGDHYVYTWQTMIDNTYRELFLFFDRRLKEGYIWIFPYGHRAEVGFGEDYRVVAKRGLKYYIGLLEEYTGEYIDPTSVQQEVLPLHGDVRLSDGNLFYVGTSAGLIDPMTGGGIKYAIISGTKLAKSICQSRSRPSIAKKLYMGRMLRYITEIKLLAKARDMVLKELHENPENLYRKAVELMEAVKKRGASKLTGMLALVRMAMG